MNSMHPNIPAAAGDSSPQWEKAARGQDAAPRVMMMFAQPRARSHINGKQRLVSFAAAGLVQVFLAAGLVYGLVYKGGVMPEPMMVVQIDELTVKEPPPPPPTPKLLPPNVIVPTITAPVIYEPPPEVITPPAPAPTALTTSSTPVTGDPQVAIQDFQVRLLRHLNRHKRGKARSRREQDIVYVRFAMDRNGRVLSTALEKGCAFEALNDEAVAMVRRSSPMPPPPAEVAGNTVELVVPIDFRQR
jgi:protein TonB